MKVRLLKSDGKVHADTDKVSLVNYPIATLFSQLDVYMAGTLISSSNNTYAFRSIIETLLNYGPDAKDTQLGIGLYTKDSAGHLEETNPVGNNTGLQQRNAFTQ